jgi:hypothetical protein
MMHADLIDQEDFRERLVALGLSIPAGASAEQACELAVSGLSPERAVALRRLVEELLGGSATLLPNVREAISRHLLPALVGGKEAGWLIPQHALLDPAAYPPRGGCAVGWASAHQGIYGWGQPKSTRVTVKPEGHRVVG